MGPRLRAVRAIACLVALTGAAIEGVACDTTSFYALEGDGTTVDGGDASVTRDGSVAEDASIAESWGDDFNRADSTELGSNWTERGDFRITSQTLRNAVASQDAFAFFSGNFGDVTASVQMQITGGNGETLLGVRLGSGFDRGYMVALHGTGVVALTLVDTFLNLGNYTIAGYAAGQWVTVTLHAIASTITVDVDGVERIRVTEGTPTTGTVGLWSYQPSEVESHRFDNFVVHR